MLLACMIRVDGLAVCVDTQPSSQHSSAGEDSSFIAVANAGADGNGVDRVSSRTT